MFVNCYLCVAGAKKKENKQENSSFPMLHISFIIIVNQILYLFVTYLTLLLTRLISTFPISFNQFLFLFVILNFPIILFSVDTFFKG